MLGTEVCYLRTAEVVGMGEVNHVEHKLWGAGADEGCGTQGRWATLLGCRAGSRWRKASIIKKRDETKVHLRCHLKLRGAGMAGHMGTQPARGRVVRLLGAAQPSWLSAYSLAGSCPDFLGSLLSLPSKNWDLQKSHRKKWVSGEAICAGGVTRGRTEPRVQGMRD